MEAVSVSCRGGEVQVLYRGRPVARLTGLVAARGGAARGGAARGSAGAAHRQELIRAGVLRPSSRDPMRLLDEPPLELPVGTGHSVVEQRADRA